MLRLVNGDALLVGGVIDKVSFSGEKAVIQFRGKGGTTIEYRKGKKKRADHVRKLKLKPGETIIASGGLSKTSPIHGFGWDVLREGRVSSKEYVLVSGSVKKVIKGARHKVLTVRADKDINIRTSSSLEGIEEGEHILCLCYSYNKKECTNPCGNGNEIKCAFCRKMVARKRYVAMKVEKEEYYGYYVKE